MKEVFQLIIFTHENLFVSPPVSKSEVEPIWNDSPLGYPIFILATIIAIVANSINVPVTIVVAVPTIVENNTKKKDKTPIWNSLHHYCNNYNI